MATPPAPMRDRVIAGLRAGIPFGVASFVLAMSFPVVAEQAGFGPIAAVAASALIFAGSAQFTAVAVLIQGGGAGAAIAAATLMNARYLPMGIALAPSLRGGRLRRAIEGQAVVDASWAMASRGDGTFDRGILFGSTLALYTGWVSGTVAGVVAGDLLTDPAALGLDAIYPAFFLALLMNETRTARGRVAAGLGAAIALALTPVAPAGLPVLLASAAALIALWRRSVP
ncbi:AzlC family ABC transporter permease [Svornostia abyssi]|uniref:AzlC family ABC transporter permease n=1 Tax=Svornostia abyssi TaxID=2898438 RepID=A0ABY5PCS5_9ACTN|nr:AzlC family ABC transporter permease [Parviterribacteraceae bacterium J379]